MKKRKRISRRLVPNPSIPKTITEEEEDEEEIKSEEEEEHVPLQGRTQLENFEELERRKSATGTPLSTQVEPLELSSLEDEVQQWVDEKSKEGDDVFSTIFFSFHDHQYRVGWG